MDVHHDTSKLVDTSQTPSNNLNISTPQAKRVTITAKGATSNQQATQSLNQLLSMSIR